MRKGQNGATSHLPGRGRRRWRLTRQHDTLHTRLGSVKLTKHRTCVPYRLLRSVAGHDSQKATLKDHPLSPLNSGPDLQGEQLVEPFSAVKDPGAQGGH